MNNYDVPIMDDVEREVLKVQLDEGAFPPERAHPTDAGLDLRSPVDALLRPGKSAVIRTGVHIQLPANTCGLIVAKSGLNVMEDITSTGLIDEGYTGEIVVKLYNHGPTHRTVKKGQKISQLVIMPVVYAGVELVQEIRGGPRGDNGFGSTGV